MNVRQIIEEHDRVAYPYPVPWHAEQNLIRDGYEEFVVYTWREADGRRAIKFPLGMFEEVYEFSSAKPVTYLPRCPLQAPRPDRFFTIALDGWWFVIDARLKTIDHQGLDEAQAEEICAALRREFGNTR